MDADWSVELGAEDAVLEVPWSAPDRRLQFIDVRHHPDAIDRLDEVRRYPEIGGFLRAINGASTGLSSVKCDVWESGEIEPAEEIFGGSYKVGAYCDVILSEGQGRDFARHEAFVRRATELLRHAPTIPASAEFVVRRCIFADSTEAKSAFSVTCFVMGYGPGRDAARRQWKIALDVIANALLQTAAEDAKRSMAKN